MKITRQNVADKIADYVQGKVGQAELVDWAERAMMDGEFEPADAEFSRTSPAASGWQMSPSSDCAGKIATFSPPPRLPSDCHCVAELKTFSALALF